MTTLTWILSATLINGLIAFVGAFALFFKNKQLEKLIFILVAFATGALLGGAFFHLIPEVYQKIEGVKASTLILTGFCLFFIIERILHWRHCHEQNDCDTHPVSSLVLIGDGIHNLADGLIIAGAFLVDIRLGVITSLLIISHEIPQELGNFAILLKAKMPAKRALIYNFIFQCTAIIGGIVGYIIGKESENFVPIVLAFAAGGFIYISASDLLPELHKESNLKKSITSFFIFLLGIIFAYITKVFFE
ncbi:MAG: ZIP family metal transporter [Patescibacteria group bacterium]